jgi:tRNA U34 5-carboxymethylaminomethyl modifying enzyme MnmG/GidA
LFTGEEEEEGGRKKSKSSKILANCLKSLDLGDARLKTGTPPRILTSSIDFSVLEVQPWRHPKTMHVLHRLSKNASRTNELFYNKNKLKNT